MLPPALDSLSVPSDATGGKNGLPQGVDGLVPPFVGKYLLRPGPGGVRADGPLESAGGHGVVIGPGGTAGGPLPCLDAVGIYTFEHFRVAADDI